MGTWSAEPFGNDTAADWAYGLEETNDFSLIQETLDAVVQEEDYLDADLAQEAVGAAETLAKLLGRGSQVDVYTESVDKWVQSVSLKPDAELLATADKALERILADESELKELWEEGDEGGEWTTAIRDLQKRLRS